MSFSCSNIQKNISKRKNSPHGIQNNERPRKRRNSVYYEESTPDTIKNVICQIAVLPNVELIHKKCEQQKKHPNNSQKKKNINHKKKQIHYIAFLPFAKRRNLFA